MTPRTIVLQGRLVSGLGEGTVFTQLDWVADEFGEKLGFAPYPGTLNLYLKGHAWIAAGAKLMRAAGIPIVPPNGYCAARCFPVTINDRTAGAAVLPDLQNYLTDKLELLAPIAIRQELNLQDGATVHLRLELQ